MDIEVGIDNETVLKALRKTGRLLVTHSGAACEVETSVGRVRLLFSRGRDDVFSFLLKIGATNLIDFLGGEK